MSYTTSTCKNCRITIWWDPDDLVWRHDEHEGQTCGSLAPDDIAEPMGDIIYPVDFDRAGGRVIKLITPGSPDSGEPIVVTFEVDKMEPGTTHRLEIRADGTIAVHSDTPFIEVPPDVAPEDEDAYVAAMTEKHESIRAEFMEELRDTLERQG